MYKLSGGTDTKMRKCAECRYLATDMESAGFKNGMRDTYRCSKHPDKTEAHIWSPDYPACKSIGKQKETPKYTIDINGQYSLILA